MFIFLMLLISIIVAVYLVTLVIWTEQPNVEHLLRERRALIICQWKWHFRQGDTADSQRRFHVFPLLQITQKCTSLTTVRRQREMERVRASERARAHIRAVWRRKGKRVDFALFSLLAQIQQAALHWCSCNPAPYLHPNLQSFSSVLQHYTTLLLFLPPQQTLRSALFPSRGRTVSNKQREVRTFNTWKREKPLCVCSEVNYSFHIISQR